MLLCHLANNRLRQFRHLCHRRNRCSCSKQVHRYMSNTKLTPLSPSFTASLIDTSLPRALHIAHIVMLVFLTQFVFPPPSRMNTSILSHAILIAASLIAIASISSSLRSLRIDAIHLSSVRIGVDFFVRLRQQPQRCQSYVEDLRAENGQKRCAKMARLFISDSYIKRFFRVPQAYPAHPSDRYRVQNSRVLPFDAPSPRCCRSRASLDQSRCVRDSRSGRSR